jgi:hypothetical protein
MLYLRGIFKKPNWYEMILYGLIALGVAVRLYVIFSIHLFQEDALITLRYAKNLWDGWGFVYNPAEHILGATSPLWTLLTSPIVGLFTFELASKLIALVGTLFFASSAIVSLRLCNLWRLTPTTRFVLLSILSLHPTLVNFSVSGMETPLFVLLLVLSLYELSQQRQLTAFLFAGLLILTRPEGVIWFGCVFCYVLVKDRRFPWKESLVSTLTVAPWIGFAWLYFGSPIPQSAIAKSNWISNEITVIDLLWRPSSLYAKWLGFSGISFPSLPSLAQGLLAIVWAAFFVVGIIIAYRLQLNPILLLSAFFLAYMAFYYFGNARVFEWYWMPGIFSVAFVIALALGTVIEISSNTLLKNPRSSMLGCVFVSIAFFVLMSALLAYKMEGFRISQYRSDTVSRPLGEYLARCADAQATIMLEPIGYIGYFSGKRIIDLAGLVSPQFASIRQKQQPGWMIERIREMRPEYIVLRSYEVPSNQFFASGDAPLFTNHNDRTWFLQSYILEKEFGSGKWGLVIYRRSDISKCD